MNLAFWLSIILAMFSCLGLVVAGRGKWQGWLIGLCTQPVWAWFAVVTKSYGLLLVGVMYTTVYTKNLIKWRKDSKKLEQLIKEETERLIEMKRRYAETDKSDAKSETVFELQGIPIHRPFMRQTFTNEEK